MIAIDLAVKIDWPPGVADYAMLETVIHQALSSHGVPVVDVEVDDTRVVDTPFPQSIGAPDLPVAPQTLPPGVQRRGPI